MSRVVEISAIPASVEAACDKCRRVNEGTTAVARFTVEYGGGADRERLCRDHFRSMLQSWTAELGGRRAA